MSYDIIDEIIDETESEEIYNELVVKYNNLEYECYTLQSKYNELLYNYNNEYRELLKDEIYTLQLKYNELVKKYMKKQDEYCKYCHDLEEENKELKKQITLLKYYKEKK